MIQVLRERHETPEELARRLETAGGRNRFGEANYRVIWGWNRLAWIGGKFEDRDAHGSSIIGQESGKDSQRCREREKQKWRLRFH